VGATEWALLSALFGGGGVVLQQKGTMAAPPAASDVRGFVAGILRSPAWIAGGVCQAGCWACQGLALARGPLFLVQPICSLQIVLALPLGVAITHQVVRRSDWLASGLVVVGLTVFLLVGHPSTGRVEAPAAVWVAATLCVAALALAAWIPASTRSPALGAALLGAAGGVVYGYQAAVMKAFVAVAPGGLHAIVTSWSTYALVLSSLVGFWLVQSALQLGALAPANASANAACPIAAVLLGRFVFLETPSRTAGGKIVSVASLVAMLAGIAWLARGESQPRRSA
jgi:drug/metabolite transporter (DMT)-like permease